MFAFAVGDANLTRVNAGLQCGQTDWIRRTQRTTPTLELGLGFWFRICIDPGRTGSFLRHCNEGGPGSATAQEVLEFWNHSLFSFVLPSKTQSPSDFRSTWPEGTVRRRRRGRSEARNLPPFMNGGFSGPGRLASEPVPRWRFRKGGKGVDGAPGRPGPDSRHNPLKCARVRGLSEPGPTRVRAVRYNPG